MKKQLYFINDRKDIYNKALSESIIEELKESIPQVKCICSGSFWDILKADVIIVCGDGKWTGGFRWALSVFRKPLIMYYVSQAHKGFQQFAKKSRWVVTKEKGDYQWYPNPLLLSDMATVKRINRIWSKEKLLSKRGSIGIAGLDLEEGFRKKMAGILDLLVEDLDLNIIFVPVTEEDNLSMQEVSNRIKFSSNTRHIQTEKYSSGEVLGIMSKIDILLTSDFRGAICSMASGRPVIGLNPNEALTELLQETVEEDILLDMDKLSDEEIYTKIKIAWVHRESITTQIHKKINTLKASANEGIIQLSKKIAEI